MGQIGPWVWHDCSKSSVKNNAGENGTTLSNTWLYEGYNYMGLGAIVKLLSVNICYANEFVHFSFSFYTAFHLVFGSKVGVERLPFELEDVKTCLVAEQFREIAHYHHSTSSIWTLRECPRPAANMPIFHTHAHGIQLEQPRHFPSSIKDRKLILSRSAADYLPPDESCPLGLTTLTRTLSACPWFRPIITFK